MVSDHLKVGVEANPYVFRMSNCLRQWTKSSVKYPSNITYC